jgi:NhaP-type Na+/H+ or K+/H+ antiporter
METFTTLLALVGIVIIAGSLVSGAVEKRGLPLVAAFLALGAALGPWGLGVVNVDLHSGALHVLAMLGLALVLFSDAVTIDAGELRARWSLVWRILGPGTLVPALLITLAARYLLDVSWPAAAILGAALASTDPVLLRSMLRSPALPPTTRIALRFESGMNDVVLLPVVILAILVLRPDEGENGMARSIVGLFILGPILGTMVGWVGIRMLSAVRRTIGVRRDYESLYALGLAFTGYAVAESVGGSGFLAAFAAGLMVSLQDVELCDCFLEYGEATAEMLLLLTFVALGTSLIWTGFTVISPATIAFTAIALVVRTIVLYPVLTAGHVTGRDRKLIAVFGPRGLSSLLLALLPVFAGVRDAEQWFAITALVVLCSVVLHGAAITYFLRTNAEPVETRQLRRTLPVAAPIEELEAVADRITLDEVRRLREAGEEVIILDARADRNRRNSETQAAGSIRVHPHEPVQDAKALQLSKRATLVVYCA